MSKDISNFCLYSGILPAIDIIGRSAIVGVSLSLTYWGFDSSLFGSSYEVIQYQQTIIYEGSLAKHDPTFKSVMDLLHLAPVLGLAVPDALPFFFS